MENRGSQDKISAGASKPRQKTIPFNHLQSEWQNDLPFPKNVFIPEEGTSRGTDIFPPSPLLMLHNLKKTERGKLNVRETQVHVWKCSVFKAGYQTHVEAPKNELLFSGERLKTKF